MKRTLFLTAVLACRVSEVTAATYTNLTEQWCDETNNVIYNGNGYFAVESAANTRVDLTINLNSLTSYVNANDYTGNHYMLLWDTDKEDYGIADNADISVNSPDRTPYLSGYWQKASWNQTTNNISYAKLSQYADNGSITLSIANVIQKNQDNSGVTITTTDSSGNTVRLYRADTLLDSTITTMNGYYVNLNYVTAVTLHTASTLDTATYIPPQDYSIPFVSERTVNTTVGRVTFLGDSITHGVDDQSYRWQLFKTFTDNGIENQIAGPRSGYNSTEQDNIEETRDAGSTYGKTIFANVHLAQASGRTRNIINGATIGNSITTQSGVNYGGHSTASTAEKYDSNTWFCMMGTNDLLSDNGTSTDIYAAKMQEMLGGTVSYDGTTNAYMWKAGESWGNMGKIVGDVHNHDDTFYMLSITPWGTHANNQDDNNRLVGAEFNKNLKSWCEAYSQSTGKRVVYVDVTRGMVDITDKQPFRGHDTFFNRPGTSIYPTHDGLHPGEQGSLIMAGNLAQAMGIGGRTAGLERQGTEGWSIADIGTVAAGTSASYAQNAFTIQDGYTIDFAAGFGNGATDGWLGAENALSVSLGDGQYSGTLNVSEGYISWGSEVLFCWDNSTLAAEGNLRIAWHNGNEADNVLRGYYVWLGDMLIGQGLAASENANLNGITISATGSNGTIKNLAWANTAYAPTTNGLFSAEHAFLTVQDDVPINPQYHNNTPTPGDVDFGTLTQTNKSTSYVYQQAGDPTKANIITTLNDKGQGGWVGLFHSNSTDKPDVAAQVTGNIASTVFGSMQGQAGSLLVQVDGGTIAGGIFNNVSAAIAGSHGGGNADAFRVFVNSGNVNGDIVGGAINGSGTINEVRIVVNNGSVDGSIYAGSKTEGTVGAANITINGGTINGNIIAGGIDGTLGNTNITINGGIIKGNISKGSVPMENGAKATVSIVGNKANISGNITADAVTLKNLVADAYPLCFANYTGTITADTVTLDNVNTDIAARLSGVSALHLLNGSATSVIMGDAATLSRLTLGNNTVLGVYKNEARQATTAGETRLTIGNLCVGAGATLNANLELTQNSVLDMQGCLAMGSEVALASTTQINLTGDLAEQLLRGVEVQLFSGIDKLLLDGQEVTGHTVAMANVSVNGEAAAPMELTFGNGVLSLSIPEPSTATLCMLALAGLAARRRRCA